MKIKSNGIEIEVEDSGAAPHADGSPRPVVLLIMGLGMQLIAWPPELVMALVGAGYRVVRFDNRDAGLSTRMEALGTPNLVWEGLKHRMGWRIRAPYSITDMATDTVGVLDALNIERAHVVGLSMGGMIAQRVALQAPSRVLSLTSIMSSSGARGLPEAQPTVLRAMLSRPADKSRQAAIEHTVKLFKAIGSPSFPMSEAELRARVAAAAERSLYPKGIARQMLAVVADTSRAQALGRITAPTLVVHGRADPLVPFACGEDTARRIPGARLEGIDGMGHDLPTGVVERLVPMLVGHFRGVEGGGATRQ